MPRPDRLFSADEWLTLRMLSTVQQFNDETTGALFPIGKREVSLLDALRHIAEGEVRMRDARDFAADAVARWRAAWYGAMEKQA